MIIPTYSAELNSATGGGLKGLFEVFGDEGVGKTGICMSLFRHAVGMYIDMDGTFPHHMRHLMGEGNVNLIPGHSLSPGEVLSIIDTSANAGCDLVVIDPIGVWDDWTISSVIPSMHMASMKTGIAIGIINHCHGQGTSKGNITCSLYCHTRIEMRRSEDSMPDGMVTNFEVKKNIYGPNSMTGQIYIDFMEEQYG